MTRLKLLLVLIASVTLSGCATFHQRTPIYIIDKEDIIPVELHETYVAPKQGFFVSDFYMTEVMDAKVSQAKKTS